jgi:hypothetical protein
MRRIKLPIKDLSEYRRLPRLGKIRLGKIVEKNGKRYPVATSYFVVPDEVATVYGSEPKELDILIPGAEIEDIFSQWFKRYGSSTGLKCRGDGVVASRMDDKGRWEQVACQGRECPDYIAKECHERASLMFVLPKVQKVGAYQLDTGSINGIIAVNSSLELIRAVAGRFHMIPCLLVLMEREVQVEGKKRKIRHIGIEVRLTLKELRALGLKSIGDTPMLTEDARKTPALPAGFPEEEKTVVQGVEDPEKKTEEAATKNDKNGGPQPFDIDDEGRKKMALDIILGVISKGTDDQKQTVRSFLDEKGYTFPQQLKMEEAEELAGSLMQT